MVLKESGEARIHRTGRSLSIDFEPLNSIFKHKLFINLEGLKRVLDGKQATATVFELLHDSRVSEKFDL